jgi:uncharacterized protein (DUF1499 family)
MAFSSAVKKRLVFWPIALLVSGLISLLIVNRLSGPPGNLGVVEGELAPCPDKPNCVSSQAKDAGHRVEPLKTAGGLQESWSKLKAVIAAQPRMTVVSERPDYLHVEARSAWLRFADDLEFYLDRRAEVIHVRSASRIGYSDLGVNRRRVEAIRQAMGQ